ncbi:MAG: hypothetical protein WC552_04305 [Candidatus Omnitrophota bacterium]
MKRFVDVYTGEVMAGREEVVLKSNINHPGLVIVAYDPSRKIGGLAHAMFSSVSDKTKDPALLRDVDMAINEMMQDMSLLGAAREDIEVSLVSGENVPRQEKAEGYAESVNSAMDLLKEKHIRVKNNLLADEGKSHVLFDVESGSISYT